MRIGILTFHRAHNCGAMLQAWALMTVLKRMGHSVEFPACNSVGAARIPMVRRIPKGRRGLPWLKSFLGRLYLDLKCFAHGGYASRAYERFLRAFLPERDCKAAEFGKYYDVVVAGSDQVWRRAIAGADAGLFRGETVPAEVPMISYAASIGDSPLPDVEARELAASLARQKHISVREPLARDQMSAFGVENIAVVLDPTLLLRGTDYIEVASRNLSRKPFIYMYSLGVTKFEMFVAKCLAKRLDLNLVVSPVCFDSIVKDPSFDYHTGPSEMIRHMLDAEYVIASSFHGTALSLALGKKFISLRNVAGERESRPRALLSKFGLESRLVDPSTPVDSIVARLTEPIPQKSLDKLADLAEASRRWLADAIDSPVCVRRPGISL